MTRLIEKIKELQVEASRAGHNEGVIYLGEVLNLISQLPLSGNVLVVEDGSVDTDELEKQGYRMIVYRQGATPPRFAVVSAPSPYLD